MEGLETIMTRRSVRAFTEKPVEDGDVETLLRAAMAAPSAGNQQPWRFVVVTDRDTLERMSTTSPFAECLKEAPLAIVVCADQTVEKHVGFWVQDCSAATQNILLAAHGLGLGGVWLGYYPVRERVGALSSLLGLPDGITPLCVVPIGYPSEDLAPAQRYEEAHVHFGRW
jgi:nitroreductase